jgi:hypothetical protein
MSPKQEAEHLMNELLPVAEQMLRQHGEFFPYGGYMKPDGEIVHVGAKDPATERPKSKALIAIMQNSFQELVRNKQCKAVALVFDVFVLLPKSNRKSDAIQVCVDHVENYSAEVFFPYKMANHEVIFGEVFAQRGEHLFFKR